MARPYKKRGGQGKCGANRFLMNRAARRVDSAAPARAEIDKPFVIQNLFRKPLQPALAREIFFNYSLDSKLSPPREAALVEPVDNRPQDSENKSKFLPGQIADQSRCDPRLVKKPRMCRQTNRAVAKDHINGLQGALPSPCPANKKARRNAPGSIARELEKRLRRRVISPAAPAAIPSAKPCWNAARPCLRRASVPAAPP